jgi:glycosyltransferase involved in cell wall biosynthesis
MITRPRVSIVITSYNYAQFVGRTIASALAQSEPAKEVIVVVDGSTDPSREIIAGFGDRVRAVFQANRGETAATNAGFALSRGDIIMFVDSDDVLRQNAVETVVHAWRPAVVAAHWPVQPIDASGRAHGEPFPKFRKERTPAQLRAEMLRCGLYACPPSSGCAYARAFLERLMPLDQEIFHHGPDGPINTVAPLYGEVITIDEALSFYRIHGGNMWAQQKLRPEAFAGYIRVDRQRAAYLRHHAAALGIALPEDLLDRGLFHLSYRIASRKLRPTDHPVPRDYPVRLLWHACGVALRSQDEVTHRIITLIWMAAMAAAPRRLAERIAMMRFIGKSRPALLVAAMTWAGIMRRNSRQGGFREDAMPVRDR